MCSQLQSFIFSSGEPNLQYSLWATLLGNRGAWQSSSECLQLHSDPVRPQGTGITQKAELAQLLLLVVCCSPGVAVLAQDYPTSKCFTSGTTGTGAQCCGNSSHVLVSSGDQLILAGMWGSAVIDVPPLAACTRAHTRAHIWRCSATDTQVHPRAQAVCSTGLGWMGHGREAGTAWVKKEKKLSGLVYLLSSSVTPWLVYKWIYCAYNSISKKLYEEGGWSEIVEFAFVEFLIFIKDKWRSYIYLQTHIFCAGLFPWHLNVLCSHRTHTHKLLK